MDETNFASSPLIFLLGGAVLLALFIYLFQSTRKTVDRITAPRSRLTYECVAKTIEESDEETREKFPELAGIADQHGLSLVRFGLFNWGDLELTAEQIVEPVSVVFPNDSEIVSALLGETIKTDFTLPEPITIHGNKAVFPTFGIAARGTLIFNFIVRGPGDPEAVIGELEGGAHIRRMG